MDIEKRPEQTPGAQIKADRESKGITLAQLAQATKIMPGFLEALEKDDYAALPGHVFARGFIRSIYKALSLDPSQVIASYDRATTTPDEEDTPSPAKPIERVKQPSLGKAWNWRLVPTKVIVSAAALGVAAIGLVWMLTNSGSESSHVGTTASKDVATIVPSDTADQLAATAEVSTADVAAEENPSQEVEEDVAPTASDSSLASTPGAQGMVAETSASKVQLLELIVKKSVKIRVNIDQRGWETNELPPDTYQFRFEDAANLLLFNAAAVDLSFNGRSLGPLGDEGRVRRLSFVAGAPDKAKM